MYKIEAVVLFLEHCVKMHVYLSSNPLLLSIDNDLFAIFMFSVRHHVDYK